jgi:hypothetical protein
MSPHEQQIVRALADSIRVLSLNQIARIWWSESRSGRSRAKASMASLVDDGWLHMQRVLSRSIVSPTRPLIDWQLGDERPDFGAAVRVLHQRAMTDAKLITVVFATSSTITLLGKGRVPTIRLTQMTHDLSLSELFLYYRKRGLPLNRWVSEDRLPSDWPIPERPDAVLRDESGQVVRAVEYGGDYPASRLLALHDGLASMELGYELW